MIELDSLASLDLRSLSTELAARAPAISELQSGQWLGVIQLMTTRLVDECESLSAESWAVCSSAISYAFEAALASGAINQREVIIRRLNLGVALLQRVIPNTEIDLLNPDHLVDLMFEELPISADQVRALSVDWRSQNIAQIRQLRATKNLVSPALSLAILAPAAVGGRLQEWEELFPALP